MYSMNVMLTQCFVYPIKGCAAVPVDTLCFNEAGQLIGDRDWVVVNAQRRLCWLGDTPQLTQIQPRWIEGRLHIESGDGAVLPLPDPAHCTACQVEYWDSGLGAFSLISGFDAGDAMAERASCLVGAAVRLVHVPSRNHRPRDLHIICKASLCELLQLAEDDEASLQQAVLRFRPNLLLDTQVGQSLPFVEDHALELRVHTPSAELTLLIDEPCQRCVAIDVDPNTGEADPRYLQAVTRTTQARAPLGGSRFGVYARAMGSGELHRGAQGRLLLNF